MAGTEEKTKAAAKSRKTSAAKETGAVASSPSSAAKKAPAKKAAAKKTVEQPAPTHHQIAELARRYWEEGGHRDGNADQDWARAERELRGQHS